MDIVKKKLDGSSEETKASIEEGAMSFETEEKPAPGSVPTPTQADAGKIIGVDDEGNYELQDKPSGGTKLYQIAFKLTDGTNEYDIKLISLSSNIQDSTLAKVTDEALKVYFSDSLAYYNGYDDILLASDFSTKRLIDYCTYSIVQDSIVVTPL